jgi:FkbM family methyltransferase
MTLADLHPMDWRGRALRAVLRRVPRGRYRLLDLLAPSRGRAIGRLADDLGGAAFAADLSDALSREVCFTGIYEPPITRVFLRHVPRGGTVVDAGANWGYFSLIAAAAAGRDGRVLALEPDPRHCDLLAANVALNGFTQVQTVRAAAADRAGTLTLTGYDDREANRGVSRIAASGAPATGRRFEVAAATIDALTDAIPVVDLVKIDVEGAEDLVLAGMQRGLDAHRYRAILLELHPPLLRERGIDPEGCVRLLHDAGYRGSTIDASPDAYRRAIDPRVPLASLLRPVDAWRQSAWPHLLWLC